MLDLEFQSIENLVGLRRNAKHEYLELNIPLLRKAVDTALSAPNWDQTAWVKIVNHFECGTAMCLAGFTVIELLGGEPRFSDGDSHSFEVEYMGETHGIPNLAQRELGLTQLEAEVLFNPANNAKTIRRISDILIEAEEYRLAQLENAITDLSKVV